MIRRLIPLLLLLPLATTLACTKNTKADDTGGGGDGGGGDTGGGGDGGSPFETGCITVDGAGSYAWINDAQQVAIDGSTISLEACTGTHDEAVVLTKALTLVGGSGLTLTATGDVPLTVNVGATVQDLVIESSKAAVHVEGATGATLQGLSVSSPGKVGIEIVDSTELVLADSTVSGAPKGGVSISGGSATVQGCTVSDSTGFGIALADGAVVTVQDTLISGVAMSNPTSTSLNDGFGIFVDHSSLSTSGNTLEGVNSYGIYADTGSLDLSGDTITGTFFGVLASDTDLVADGLTVTDAIYTGIYAYSPSSAEVSNTTIVGTPGVVNEVTADEWNKATYLSAGIHLVAPTTAVTDSSITGYTGVGLLAAAPSGTGSTDLTRVALADQSNHGIYLISTDTYARDVTVSGTQAVTTSDADRCFTLDTDVGVAAIDSDLDWSGGSVTDVVGYGISDIYGAVTVDGATFANTTCAAVMAFQGSGRVTYSDFSGAQGGSFGGSVVSYQATSLYVGGSTFTDSQNEVLDTSSVFPTGDGSVTRYDYYQWLGSDIQVWYGGAATIKQNTFSNGVNGVELYSDSAYGTSTAALSNNSFTDYLGLATYVSAGSTATITDTTLGNFGPYALSCEGESMGLTRVTMTSGGEYTTRYAVYVDDVFQYDMSYSTTGPAIYASGCDVNANTVNVTDAAATGIYLANGAWQLNGVGVAGAGQVEVGDGITAYATTTSSTLYANGLDLSSIEGGHGLYLRGTASVNATLLDTTVSGTGAEGLLLENVSTSGATAIATLNRVDVAGAGTAGLHLDGFSSTLGTVDVSASVEDGIVLSAGSAALSTTTTRDNLGYGMSCERSVVVSTCDVSATGNAAGDFNGCDACAAPVEPM